MTTRKTDTKDTAKQVVHADDQNNDNESVNVADVDLNSADTAEDMETKDALQDAEPYYVEVVTTTKGVQRVNLRDDASAVDDANIDHAVAVGTRLKAVEDLGEWTKLTHGLYIMSKFVKKL